MSISNITKCLKKYGVDEARTHTHLTCLDLDNWHAFSNWISVLHTGKIYSKRSRTFISVTSPSTHHNFPSCIAQYQHIFVWILTECTSITIHIRQRLWNNKHVYYGFFSSRSVLDLMFVVNNRKTKMTTITMLLACKLRVLCS